MFSMSVFFLIFAFSCPSFTSFPLLLDFLKPSSGPSDEVKGIYMGYIYICRRVRLQGFTIETPDFQAFGVKVLACFCRGQGRFCRRNVPQRCKFSLEAGADNSPASVRS